LVIASRPIILHENSRLHTANRAWVWLWCYSWGVTGQLSYKSWSRGQWFQLLWIS
jgi:hypothetical protein